MKRLLHAAAFAAMTLVAAGCTSMNSTNDISPKLAGLRTMGYRIAVMPFAVTAPSNGFLSDSLAPVGELLSFQTNRALPMRDQLGRLLRTDVVAWLQQSDFEVVDPWQSDTQLAHAGFQPEQLRDPANARELAKLLGVDGVLFGDLRSWNRSYYVLQATAEVALHLELLDGSSRERLFAADRTETIGSGLSGGPTGYLSVATEPLAGLRGSNLRELTRSVARNAVTDLNGGALGNNPGPLTPRLTVVGLAQEHMGPFQIGERLDVIAVGSPDCDVCFDVGRLRTHVPMQLTQRHPDPRGERATYLGHYIVQAGDTAGPLPLSATIQRGAARSNVTSHYRWEGELSLQGSALGAPQATPQP